MPSRAAHLIAFLTIVALSVGAHVYIFRQLARLIRRDFPHQKEKLIRIAKAAFIYFDLPFIYIFFGKQITFDASILTTFLIFPFAVWQMVMLVWTVILVPIGIYRSKMLKGFRQATNRLILKPIARAVRRSLRPRKEVILETSEELV